VRYTLLAACAGNGQREITDTLVDLLIHIAHRISVWAEDKEDTELLTHLRKVAGKDAAAVHAGEGTQTVSQRRRPGRDLPCY